MFKKFIILTLLTLLTNCSGAGTAFLGPTFTGVKTGSVYQASLSYGSGKVMNILKNSVDEELIKSEKLSLTNNFDNEKYKINLEDPPILLAVKTYFIEVSEPTIEEPLP